MPVDNKTLDRALDTLRKQYGDSSVSLGSDKPTVKRISTGDLMLDWATGGGIPQGRWSHFYGNYMSGKSMGAWNIIREAQKLGQTCAYYNIEKQFDPEWVEKWGVDLSKLHVIDGTISEEVGEKLEILLPSINVHVLDSLGAAVSQDELAGNVGDWNPGLAARAWGKIFRRANERFDDEENTIIIINQTRTKFGYGGGETPTGGKFIEYQSSMSLHFTRSSWLYKDSRGVLNSDGSNKETLTKDNEPQGLEFQIRVAKSRVGRALRTARLRLDLETGSFDPTWSLVRAAIHFKVVEKGGAWYTLPDGKTKVHGEPGLREAIEKDKKLRREIEKLVKTNNL